MKLSKNPIFIKHKMQIEEALEGASGMTKSNGKDLYREVCVAADELDNLLDPTRGERPDPHMVTIKRDEFHKKCRDLGVWMEEHAPNLKLEWA